MCYLWTFDHGNGELTKLKLSCEYDRLVKFFNVSFFYQIISIDTKALLRSH